MNTFPKLHYTYISYWYNINYAFVNKQKTVVTLRQIQNHSLKGHYIHETHFDLFL